MRKMSNETYYFIHVKSRKIYLAKTNHMWMLLIGVVRVTQRDQCFQLCLAPSNNSLLEKRRSSFQELNSYMI